MSPEQILWQSVLMQAARDATAPNPGDTETIRAKVEADAWFRRGGKQFRQVCMMAGFDPDFIRDAYIGGRIDGKLLRSSESRP
jgi:hypothetical protein